MPLRQATDKKARTTSSSTLQKVYTARRHARGLTPQKYGSGRESMGKTTSGRTRRPGRTQRP